ncbi:hypothetical protein Forpi1262_v000267 [Fusarium oxysporum f. sp. raphani]|uniref:Uncharacterized protein n=1 Tax=Fusarium oxysporum f. sp. raphani TaxID=96318 RepID=A0A8J5Q931_FUSOX|nr:hypothetical protein Forpi1262_v000267 [Fusarium oxysporum f. sp. raphani]
MSAIGTGIVHWCHIISLRFEFMDESIERGLGDVNYEIIDSDRVPCCWTKVKSQYQSYGVLSNEDAVFDLPWIEITPSGKKATGMFSQGIGWGSKYFHNLSFISTNEEQE